MTQYGIPSDFYYADGGSGWLTLNPDGYQDQDGRSDIGFGTGSPLPKAIADTGSGSTPTRNDNTYLKSPSMVTPAVLWLYCTTSGGGLLGDPGVSAGDILNLVCRKSVVTDPATYRVTKDLYEGYREGVTDGTLIASLVVDPAPNILTLYQHELTTDEYNAIGDWGDLWFRYETTKY